MSWAMQKRGSTCLELYHVWTTIGICCPSWWSLGASWYQGPDSDGSNMADAKADPCSWYCFKQGFLYHITPSWNTVSWFGSWEGVAESLKSPCNSVALYLQAQLPPVLFHMMDKNADWEGLGAYIFPFRLQPPSYRFQPNIFFQLKKKINLWGYV